MSRFESGGVPYPDYDAADVDNFNRKVEFTDDVFIYGKLYTELDAKDITFDDNQGFKSITLSDDLFVNGLSDLNIVDIDYLTVYQRHNVGAGGTVFVAISTSSDLDGQVGGRVGIATTQPSARFQVGSGDNSFIVDDTSSIGIGTIIPAQKFQVGVDTNSLVVSGVGTLGIGTDKPGGSFTVNNIGYGTLRADFDGSIRIARNIYDSAGSVGANANFMSRDELGIRWVSFTPVETEGVFLQNEGTFVPAVGAAQSFTVLNFAQRNSNGQGTDTLEATAQNPNSVTGVATIFVEDLWGHNGTAVDAPIYRQSKVGIKNSNPSADLDVSGTLHVTNDVDFDSALNVDSGVTFNSTLDVDGVATFNDASQASSTNSGAVRISGGLGVGKKLFVGDDTVISGQTQSTDINSGALIVDGGVGVEKNINIGGAAVIAGRLDVDDNTQSSNTTTGAAVFDGGLGLGGNLNSGGSGTFAGRLDVDEERLVRRVANLIRIKDIEVLKLKDLSKD